MANGNQKQYTFINMKRCVGKNGNPYIGVTLEALVSRPDSEIYHTESGKGVINFNTPIHNGSKYIGELSGLEPYTNEAGTCWARVALWDSDPERTGLATRFKNLMEKHAGKTLVLLITGSIRVTDDPGRDGRTYRNINIIGDDFTVLRILDPKGGPNNTQRAQSSQSSGHQENVQNQTRDAATATTDNETPSWPGQGAGWQTGFDDGELPF